MITFASSSSSGFCVPLSSLPCSFSLLSLHFHCTNLACISTNHFSLVVCFIVVHVSAILISAKRRMIAFILAIVWAALMGYEICPCRCINAEREETVDGLSMMVREKRMNNHLLKAKRKCSSTPDDDDHLHLSCALRKRIGRSIRRDVPCSVSIESLSIMPVDRQ